MNLLFSIDYFIAQTLKLYTRQDIEFILAIKMIIVKYSDYYSLFRNPLILGFPNEFLDIL